MRVFCTYQRVVLPYAGKRRFVGGLLWGTIAVCAHSRRLAPCNRRACVPDVRRGTCDKRHCRRLLHGVLLWQVPTARRDHDPTVSDSGIGVTPLVVLDLATPTIQAPPTLSGSNGDLRRCRPRVTLKRRGFMHASFRVSAVLDGPRVERSGFFRLEVVGPSRVGDRGLGVAVGRSGRVAICLINSVPEGGHGPNW